MITLSVLGFIFLYCVSAIILSWGTANAFIRLKTRLTHEEFADENFVRHVFMAAAFICFGYLTWIALSGFAADTSLALQAERLEVPSWLFLAKLLEWGFVLPAAMFVFALVSLGFSAYHFFRFGVNLNCLNKK